MNVSYGQLFSLSVITTNTDSQVNIFPSLGPWDLWTPVSEKNYCGRIAVRITKLKCSILRRIESWTWTVLVQFVLEFI